MITRHTCAIASLCAAALSLLASCGDGGRPEGADGAKGSSAAGTPAPAASPAAPAAASGSLSGRAIFAAAEVPAPNPINVDTDVQFCGGKVEPENLLVDPASKGLKNVVVTVEGVTGAPVTPATVTIANKHCGFRPRVAAATVGSTLRVTNEDPVNHTTRARNRRGIFFNVSIPAGSDPITRPLRRKELIPINCDVHKWMVGWLIVHENDCHAVTGADGAFSLDAVPAGTWTVKAWHEELGVKESTVTIEPGKTSNLEFEFGATE